MKQIRFLYEPLYKEFGGDVVNRVRRELVAANGKHPSYIELYAALCLKQRQRADRRPNCTCGKTPCECPF